MSELKLRYSLDAFILDSDFDMKAYIEAKLLEVMLPEMQREEARIIYGTRAVKQRASWHKHVRREKR
jgi:hypothetical protein